jgi:hypothetical protein
MGVRHLEDQGCGDSDEGEKGGGENVLEHWEKGIYTSIG